jgi:hypothetical protein
MVVINRSAPTIISAPFDALAGQAIGIAGDDLIRALTRRVSACADPPSASTYVTLLPGPHLLDPEEMSRLAWLAEAGTLAAVLGPGVPPEPGQRIRGIGQRREPQPPDQWSAVALGFSANVAVLARRNPDGDWTYGMTHDRLRTIAAARSLVRLLGPPEPSFRYDG